MANQFLVPPDGGIKLSKIDPGDTNGMKKGDKTEAQMSDDLKTLSELQELLYVANDRALLIVLQGMDTAGKDGTISHVFSGLNPTGCNVVSFKVPTELEAAHDYLWRVHNAAPRKGVITIFNRSHYESVLVERVLKLVPEKVWRQRYEQINQFEAMLASECTIIIKFFLHISKEEQEKRLRERMDAVEKRWKVTVADWTNRTRWDDYQQAYEDALNRTSTAVAPWYIVPAEHKWFRNYLVAEVITDHLKRYRDEWQQAIQQRGAVNMKELEQSGTLKVEDKK